MDSLKELIYESIERKSMLQIVQLSRFFNYYEYKKLYDCVERIIEANSVLKKAIKSRSFFLMTVANSDSPGYQQKADFAEFNSIVTAIENIQNLIKEKEIELESLINEANRNMEVI